MSRTIRPARPGDVAAITAFTRDTFTWGDYVPGALPGWIDDPAGLVLVAATGDDAPVAVVRGVMLSGAEAWLQAIRVHPDHRRRGIADELTFAMLDWAGAAGARVVRLAIEDWNEASQTQVRRVGFRPAGAWTMTERAIGEASPLPEGNGGRRVPAPERLRRVPSAEAEPAYLSWSTGELARAGRHLFPTGWRWRRLTDEDLRRSAREDGLWAARAGWAMAARVEDTFEVNWLETQEADAGVLIRSLIEAGVESGAERIELWVPRIGWILAALRRAGCTPHDLTVFARTM